MVFYSSGFLHFPLQYMCLKKIINAPTSLFLPHVFYNLDKMNTSTVILTRALRNSCLATKGRYASFPTIPYVFMFHMKIFLIIK